MSKIDLTKLFNEWNELNKKVESHFGALNFTKIKKIRNEQKILEDRIYNELSKFAPDPIKRTLPEDVGELEVGYDTANQIFYFVMVDPTLEDDEELRLLAITISTEYKIEIIENFKIEE
jgi:hypothetical protein